MNRLGLARALAEGTGKTRKRRVSTHEVFAMRKWGLGVGLTIGALALAAPSFAATDVNVSATFAEGVPQQFGCTVENGACGTGVVVPYGRATETIRFGADCGGTCDLRTITLAQGTLVLDETFGSPTCPSGTCRSHGLGRPGSGTLTDVVLGGLSSGIFAGASGTLTGTVQGAGASTKITLSGTITLAS